jgi:hypothetical protein
MGWLEQHDVAVGVFVMLAIHWVRMEIRLAVMQRDLQWLRGQLGKWGFVQPSNGGD